MANRKRTTYVCGRDVFSTVDCTSIEQALGINAGGYPDKIVPGLSNAQKSLLRSFDKLALQQKAIAQLTVAIDAFIHAGMDADTLCRLRDELIDRVVKQAQILHGSALRFQTYVMMYDAVIASRKEAGRDPNE